MRENKAIKRCLIIQSFAPLFLLALIQYWQKQFFVLPYKFFVALHKHELLRKLANYAQYGNLIISLVAIIWIACALIIYIGFREWHDTNFRDAGEKISIEEDKRDGAASYLVTFILPILVDEVNTVRGMLTFGVLLVALIKLLVKSDIFYQNPVLALWGYQSFSFRFVNPDCDIEKPEKVYIGVTRGEKINDERKIKRKYIADNVFLVYNE